MTTEVRVVSMRFHRSRRLFDCVDTFVCPTRFTADLLVESGIAASKVAVIPTFTISASAGWDEVGTSEGYALYLGRISPEKGVDLLIDAAIANPALRLKVTGRTDGPYAAGLKGRVEEAGISDRVEFVGFVCGSEKESLIAGASCVCCPSTWFENMPNAVLEAYAHAKPVVAFDIGCMPELVKNGETGIVVPLGDVTRLGEAIASVCADPCEAKRMGDGAKRYVDFEYSADRPLELLLQVFQGR